MSRMRSSRMASLRTQALQGTMRRRRPFSRAAAANVASMGFKILLTGKSEMLALSAPASSLEMSSSALNSSFMLATAAVDPCREPVAFGLIRLRAQLRDEQVQGMQRLAQIVARCREEARLGQVGDLQLVRALLDLALERRVGALQLGRHVVQLFSERLQLVSRLDRDAMIERTGADASGTRGQALEWEPPSGAQARAPQAAPEQGRPAQ